MTESENLETLIWAHQTLMRLMALVQTNGLIGGRLSATLVDMGQAAVDMEALIAELSSDARRRETD